MQIFFSALQRKKIQTMSNVVIIGAQWGDEGKGKIVDILALDADIIVRFQGGPNAGHTVVVGDEKIILHQIPSGILHQGKTCVIGNGVVLDIETLMAEMQEVKSRGYFPDDAALLISEETNLIMPYHKRIDVARESLKGKDKIGTTGRGIGPAYEDKAARRGIRVVDIFDDEALRYKIKSNLEEKNWYLREYLKETTFDAEEIISLITGYRSGIKQYVANTSLFLSNALKHGKKVLFEGAQGSMLDVDHGTYPFVTSSNTVAGQAAIGSGVGPNCLDTIIGISKAYTTRVGSGPFPTELNDEMGSYLREQGGEYGATTGRPRRCGWFDSVVARHSIRVNGMTSFALTKLDVLSGLKTIKVCTGYRYKNSLVTEMPANFNVLENCEPVYDEVPGWSENISKIKKVADLPKAAQDYIRYIEKQTEIPVTILSLGHRRNEAIILKNPFH
jgi:adenylosuccinate synthase